jgi:hypothetical protein
LHVAARRLAEHGDPLSDSFKDTHCACTEDPVQ